MGRKVFRKYEIFGNIMNALTKWRLKQNLTLSEFHEILKEMYDGSKKNITLESGMDQFVYELYEGFDTSGEYNLVLHFSQDYSQSPCVCLNPRENQSTAFKINEIDVYLCE